jgi:NADH-quinone oxidoreductase subunit A
VVQYLPLLILLVLEVGFATQLFLVPRMFGPNRSSAVKAGPYESGIVPHQPVAARFPVRFYLVAMIFIIFDIEVVFIYPWATIYVSLTTFGLAELAAFVALVFVSFSYLISVGALDWGPPKRRGRSRPMDVSLSTVASVRRVPRPDQVAEGELQGEKVETLS